MVITRAKNRWISPVVRVTVPKSARRARHHDHDEAHEEHDEEHGEHEAPPTSSDFD